MPKNPFEEKINNIVDELVDDVEFDDNKLKEIAKKFFKDVLLPAVNISKFDYLISSDEIYKNLQNEFGKEYHLRNLSKRLKTHKLLDIVKKNGRNHFRLGSAVKGCFKQLESLSGKLEEEPMEIQEKSEVNRPSDISLDNEQHTVDKINVKRSANSSYASYANCQSAKRSKTSTASPFWSNINKEAIYLKLYKFDEFLEEKFSLQQHKTKIDQARFEVYKLIVQRAVLHKNKIIKKVDLADIIKSVKNKYNFKSTEEDLFKKSAKLIVCKQDEYYVSEDLLSEIRQLAREAISNEYLWFKEQKKAKGAAIGAISDWVYFYENDLKINPQLPVVEEQTGERDAAMKKQIIAKIAGFLIDLQATTQSEAIKEVQQYLALASEELHDKFFNDNKLVDDLVSYLQFDGETLHSLNEMGKEVLDGFNYILRC